LPVPRQGVLNEDDIAWEQSLNAAIRRGTCGGVSMRPENEFRNDCLGCELSENRPSKVSSKGEPPSILPQYGAGTRITEEAGLSRRRIAGYLAGMLLLLLAVLFVPATSSAQFSVGVSVSFGPPALPIYAQPMCPGPGYIWTPGYWAWDPAYGYYWVPGTWVEAPFVGAMWTPGYWGYNDGRYFWYAGYWGPQVGYYGGIDYGYGYTGYGYYGGYWDHDRFYYNRAVNNIRIDNTRYYYNRRVENNRFTRISYNGGPGGIRVRPTAGQLSAARRRRFGPLRQQEHQRDFARRDPRQRATVNRGRPYVAATDRPGVFNGGHAVRAARAGGAYREPPRGMRNSGNWQRSAPAGNNKGREYSAPRRQEPNARMERSAPRQNNYARRAYQGNASRSERPNQNWARAPQERRNNQRRAAPEQSFHPAHGGDHGGGNGHHPGGRSR